MLTIVFMHFDLLMIFFFLVKVTLHDMILKNIEKIKRPRSSNADALYWCSSTRLSLRSPAPWPTTAPWLPPVPQLPSCLLSSHSLVLYYGTIARPSSFTSTQSSSLSSSALNTDMASINGHNTLVSFCFNCKIYFLVLNPFEDRISVWGDRL